VISGSESQEPVFHEAEVVRLTPSFKNREIFREKLPGNCRDCALLSEQDNFKLVVATGATALGPVSVDYALEVRGCVPT